jgi:integrase
MNDVILNKKKISRFLPEDVSNHADRAYTHEEIQKLLQRCDELSRVIILLMASTGMRIGAISALQIGHLEKIAEYNLYKITVYANFPKAKYYTFCTPETAIAIDTYLEYRQRFNDPLNKTSPLIREQFEIDEPFLAANPRPIAQRTIAYIINEILKRSGLKTKEVMRSHGFRKFAITMMKKSKVDYSDREFLVGHRYSRGLDINYDRTSEEDRLQEYLKAVDLLTISQENRLRNEVQVKDHIINHKLIEKDDALVALADQVMKLMTDLQELKKQKDA